jgi:predicted ATP-dependent endonuclease of OLD family
MIKYQQSLENFIESLRSSYEDEANKTGSNINFVLKKIEDFSSSIRNQYLIEDNEFLEASVLYFQDLHDNFGKIKTELDELSLHEKGEEAVSKWLPTFIYMSDYKIFNGSAQLNEIKKREVIRGLTDEDRTTILIMELAGLSLDEEVVKGNLLDREQRILDMNDASQLLTEKIANRWTQKKYEVMFQADGQHFITFVKDANSKSLIPLEERSKGFQWFFSFDMTLMYETKGEFKNAIILLDEPGLHLHAAAQYDLLARLKEYAKSNQLIYTTHLPFMLDFSRLDNIYVAEDTGVEGTKIHKDWATADKDARFTLQAALGLSWSQSLFVGQFNLVVEGVTDFWFLTTISTMLQDEGQDGIDEQLVITPAGGASKVAYIGTILHGQKLKVMVLLDSDLDGKSAYEQLVHQWILAEKHVLMLGQVLGISHSCTIEDMFSEDYYMEHVNAAYHSELGKKNLKLGKKTNQPIVERVELALKAQGIERFNKGRVGKRIMKNLADKKLVDISEETIENFRRVIIAINNIVQVWKAK